MTHFIPDPCDPTEVVLEAACEWCGREEGTCRCDNFDTETPDPNEMGESVEEV